MPYRRPIDVLQAAMPVLRLHLPKLQSDLDEAATFLRDVELHALFLAAAQADEEGRGELAWPFAIHKKTLDAFGKKAKRDDVKHLAVWVQGVWQLLKLAHHTRPEWLRDGASDDDLTRLGDMLPYELPLAVHALLKVSNGLAPGIYPMARWDLFLNDVDTMIREYEDVRSRHGADNYLPVFSANGNHLLVKLDEGLEQRKASPALGVKGNRKVLRGGVLDYNHEEGLEAARALGSIDDYFRSIQPRAVE